MLAFALGALLAQNAAPPPPAGTVHGLVVRVGSNEPLSRATVELRSDADPAPTPPGAPPIPALVAPPLMVTTTEADGRFVLRNVRPGRYRLVTTRPGYVRRLTSVAVTSAQTATVQVALASAGAIAGRIYGTSGEPLGNVAVEALKPSYQSGRRTLTQVQLVRSDDRGEYRLFWLPPGRYFVRATHPEAQVGPMAMMLGFGPAIRFASASIGMGGPGPSGMFAQRSTGDTGLADAFGAPGGFDEPSAPYVPVYFPATVDDQAASPIEVREGGDVGGVDIVVAPVQMRHVRGAVVNGATGQIAQYASLRLVADETSMFGPGGGLSNNGRNPVDSDGTFDVTLRPGRHTLVGTAGTGEGYVIVEVGASDLDNVRIVTLPAFDIPGRISADGPVDNADLAPIRITLARDVSVSERPTSYSVPRADGTFVVSASPGDYRVNVAPLLSAGLIPGGFLTLPKKLEGAYVKSIRLGAVDVLNQGVRLQGRPADVLEIVIGTRPGTIEGSVASAPAGATVVLVPDLRQRFDLWKTAATDPSGQFRLDRIAPGNYTLYAWEDVSDGAWQDPDFLRAYEARGTAISVRDGATETARLTILPGP